MALFKTRSAAVYGIDAYPVDVEVDLYKTGMAKDFTLVGMPDTAVRESRERIKSALFNSGFTYPNKAITINLAPANVRKEGAGFDLPMALGILGSQGLSPDCDRYFSVGELSLDGAIRPIRGALSIAVCARRNGIPNLILPLENAAEAAVVEGVNVFGIRHLAEAVNLLKNTRTVSSFGPPTGTKLPCRVHRSRFRGRSRPDHCQARSPGGRSRGPQRLDDRPAGFRQNHARQTPRRHSASPHLRRSHRNHQGPQHRGHSQQRRRFAPSTPIPGAPPHISDAGLIGGGTGAPRPGEVSLAHNGLLFLDEFPEFPRNVLELLRQPLEDLSVTIARSNMTLSFPSSFMLVAAMNPCPCGFYGDPTRECRCTPAIIQRYLGKISGPLLDRIDIHIEVPAVPYKELRGNATTETSAEIRDRVISTRAIQQSRGFYNSRMPTRLIRQHCALDEAGERTLEMAVRKLSLSARAHDRMLKVARTIADLDHSPHVASKHIAEAVNTAASIATIGRDPRPLRDNRVHGESSCNQAH